MSKFSRSFYKYLPTWKREKFDIATKQDHSLKLVIASRSKFWNGRSKNKAPEISLNLKKTRNKYVEITKNEK